VPKKEGREKKKIEGSRFVILVLDFVFSAFIFIVELQSGGVVKSFAFFSLPAQPPMHFQATASRFPWTTKIPVVTAPQLVG